jgi:hypothetical protein
VFQRYLVEVEKSEEAARAMPKPQSRWTIDMSCMACDVPMALNDRESLLVCTRCGVTKLHTDAGEGALTYDQEVEQTTKVITFAYKRSNHFIEWLNTLQGKESTEIPNEVMEAVRAEFKKERACKRSDVNPTKVHAFLKKLKLSKYFEHKHAICNALNGVPAPKLPQELEDRLKRMFNSIQEPFEKHKPSTRKNFLSYAYTLYKFCQLLGEDDIAAHLPLLKSTEKLHAQDEIWRKICKELGWQYIPSL